jgi:phospholipid transport system substrate-binding protein
MGAWNSPPRLRARWPAAIGLLAILLTAVPRPAVAGEPTDQVRASVAQVLQTLRDPALKAPDRSAERRTRIRRIVQDRFDFGEMARRSLATHWAERTPQEQRDFTALFSDLLERSYIDKIEAYTDERILYVGERMDGDFAEVQTKVEGHKNLDVPIDYRLLRRDGKWWVYDVVIEGVSLIANYRTQFNKIIRSSSYAELVKRMQTKREGEVAGDLGAPTPRRR